MLSLVVAEKPSVAQAIANVLHADKKMNGYYSGNRYVVSWCLGHLVELAEPEAYDSKYAHWSRDDLPICPATWKYDVTESGRRQFEILKKWLNHNDVDTVICATDAGREGELIFRLVYEKSGCTKPVKRLWISSLEDVAIQEGFMNLKDGSAYDNLYQAALCRSHADWLVGMNASRLFSVLYGQNLSIGRVMTPTLAMIAKKENAIASFTPEPFYHVHLSCGFTAKSKRYDCREQAEQVRVACHTKAAVVRTITTTTHKDTPPYLYDLTTLQRDANRIYGYTAQQTLDYIQRLYEKRLTTYPRTDSRFVTSDMAAGINELVRKTSACFPFDSVNALYIDPLRIVCDEKVTDHHAIIPTHSVTKEQLEQLLDGERNIFRLVAARLICAVGANHIYEKVCVSLDCEGYTFSAEGITEKEAGWLAFNREFMASVGRKDNPREKRAIPDLREGQRLYPVVATIHEGLTTAPARYTEDKLLAAMESAGVEDLPEDAERKGIGTSATRAGIIEKLISTGMAERTGDGKAKCFTPTDKGLALIQALPEFLTSPLLTAEWEQRLKQIERGQADAPAFIADVNDVLEQLVASAAPVRGVSFPSKYRVLGTCPACGNQVVEKAKGAFCVNESCRFSIWWDHWFFTSKRLKVTPDLVAKLLQNGCVDCDKLWSPVKQTVYSGRIVLSVSESGRPNFTMQFPSRKDT